MKLRQGFRRALVDRATGLFDRWTRRLHVYPVIGRLARPGAAALVWLERRSPSSTVGHPVHGSAVVRRLASGVVGGLVAVRDFERAERVLTTLSPHWTGAESATWRLRQLQVWCGSGQIARAEELVAAWGGYAAVPEAASATAAALLASLGRWDDVVWFVADRVQRRMGLGGSLLMESAAAAARHTGRYGEVVASFSAGPAGADRAVARVKGALQAEEAIRHLLDGATTDFRSQDRLQSDRVALVRSVLAGRGRVSPRPPDSLAGPVGREEDALLWCTDLRYLLGTCTSVWSLLRHNPGLEPEAGFRVVAAPDAVPLATEVLADLAGAAGVKIDVMDAAELVPDGRRLRSDYGLFTPGHRLPAAAYYRLFAVRRLLASTITRRVVYLDSDTCVGPGIAGLLAFDLEGRPLAARSERQYGLRFESRRAIIEQAAHKLGVEPSSYFNSGVLVFDGAHPDVGRGLQSAIDLSIHEPERLMFHDQCALNLAFAGQAAPLPECWNGFVRPQNAAVRDVPVVLHYLEQPKPWDPLYPTLNCQRWFEELVALGSVLAPEAITRLLQGQFPPVSGSRTGAWSP